MKKYNYHLSDNGGISTAWEQEILIPIGSEFTHEFGTYVVEDFLNDGGTSERNSAKITQVHCERLKSSVELEKAGPVTITEALGKKKRAAKIIQHTINRFRMETRLEVEAVSWSVKQLPGGKSSIFDTDLKVTL